MLDERSIVDQLPTDSKNLLQSLTADKVELFSSDAVTENLSIVARVDPQMVQQLLQLNQHFADIDLNHFYYQASNIHLTLVGNMPLTIDLGNVANQLTSLFANQHYYFRIGWLRRNSTCEMLHALPVNFSLHQLRQQIRAATGEHGDDYTSILPGIEYAGWINLVRYQQHSSSQWWNEIERYSETILGETRVTNIELYRTNSKVLALNQSVLLQQIKLEGR